LPFDEFQRLCEEANDSIPSPEDCDRQLKDKFLGLIAFGKASKSLMIVSHSVWKYLQQNEEFFSETIPAAPSQLTKRPPSIKDTSTYKNTSHRNTAQERYTYTPELDIDIDDDIDNLDDHDVNNDYPREDLAGPNARKRARIYDAAESQVRISSSIITESPNVQWHRFPAWTLLKKPCKKLRFCYRCF
jgi:hypothetical protein